eukprot:scaffold45212_cov19-Tisochrysis_lutea.AAC.2
MPAEGNTRPVQSHPRCGWWHPFNVHNDEIGELSFSNKGCVTWASACALLNHVRSSWLHPFFLEV